MAYDESFARRVRDLLQGEEGVTEKTMFGGLAFLVDGHMALAVSGRDLMMIRADAKTADLLLERDGIGRTIMRDRPMSGWLDVDGTATADDDTLRELVTGAVTHARALPPKA